MSHNEKRTDWVKEGIMGFATGVLFGVTSVCIGHVIIYNYSKPITIYLS
jgi:hypothetical protein